MTGQPDRPKYTFEHLEDLTVEQLEELLSASVDISDSNEAYVDAIIDAIVRKERENPTGRLPDVDEAWQSFQEDFNTAEGEGLSLYPDEVEEEQPASLAKAAPAKKKARRSGWNYLAVAAVIAVCFVTLAPPALGYVSIFDMVGHWNETIFSFFNINQEEEEPPEDVAYDSLEEALEADGVTNPVVPAIPGIYKVIVVDVQRFPEMGKTNYNAVYQSDEKVISIYIVRRENPSARQLEKDENFVEEYIVNDIKHYISRNNDKLWVAWYVNNLECTLQTEEPIDVLKTMIDSIYER